ncbi:alkaline phosphatase [Desulfomonile tiedjei]|uniref:Alkaline phosphatase n=1 Tax=Desulfomonile tiedjei (strain ATCC 49306 / DSM 6799 / DCB-1) TaxID=706587 RepID=I4C284_DESTA|nr:alkaline phosphatase [Desulfomonile tiedjei]AFM23675.1 Alkaline phosphatase [Desulfomonile tiedjei DSM 6799]
MKETNSIRRFVSVLAVIIVLTLNVSAYAEDVKGIILLIGDGMGLNQIRSAEIYAKEVLNRPLAINSMVTRGTTTTYSANAEVTDSAAAATAIYSGYKTDNGVLNILPDGKYVSNVAQAAKDAQLSVGVVSTTRLTHATPAGVYSHSLKRNDENFIAEQLLTFAPEVAMAGGRGNFLPQSEKSSKRKDDKNLIEMMKKDGYTYVANNSELQAVDPDATRKLLGLFAGSHLSYDLDRQNVEELKSEPTLSDMTRTALAILAKNPRGFFLMVEGGRIDHACHLHDIKGSIYETLAFDDAVKVALDFQKTHPDVLVIVTADHETGGLGLGTGSIYAVDFKALEPIRNSLEFLTKKMSKDPANANELLKAAGYEYTEKEHALLSKYPPDMKPSQIPEFSHCPKIDTYIPAWIVVALGNLESNRAKIGWTSYVHTAQPVITFASGPGEKEFQGAYDNTDIAKKMAKLLGLTMKPPYTPDTETK